VRDVIIWVITVEVLGFVAAPPLRAFFSNRRDAALLSRPVGLALVAYLGWVLSLSKSIGFERGTLLLALALLAVAAVFVHRSWRRATAAREPFWGPDETRAALFFWAPAAVFLAIRAAVPEILGAEKFMDLSFLNSLIRHDAMPPLDPWMAGKTINYYYWGYLLAAVLAKLSGISSFVAYNLAVATFAGYSFAAAACLGLRLSGGKTAAGVWAGIGAVFAGMGDLSVSLGHGGDLRHPEVEAAGAQVHEICTRHGIPCVGAASEANVAERLEQGFKILMFYGETSLDRDRWRAALGG